MSFDKMMEDLMGKQDSLRLLQHGTPKGSSFIKEVPDETPFEKEVVESVNPYDDVLHKYSTDDSSVNIAQYGEKGNKFSVDVDKVYNALDKIDINNPEYSEVIDKITETDNWMWTSDTPKEHAKFVPGYANRPYSNLDMNNPKYKSWTAANAFGVGVVNPTDNEYFDTYNEVMEDQHDILNSAENPWGPNILGSSLFFNEKYMSPEISRRFGPEAYNKADAIASDKARIAQINDMKAKLAGNPNSKQTISLLKALTILDEFENQ